MWNWLNNDPSGSMVFSWIKVFAATVLALFLADGADVFAVDANDLRTWLAAGFAALLPVVINYINPNDGRYGNLGTIENSEFEVFDEEEYKGEA